MGRYDFRPSRVYQATSRLLGTPKLENKPSWFEVVGSNPPSQILVRTQPIQHNDPLARKHKGRPSKQFRPRRIIYDEDDLRRTFFMDHPWELARPRVVLEDYGNDYQGPGGTIVAHSRTVNGESVVQRQQYLMHGGMSKQKAYDEARGEFYQQRLQEDVEVQVAKEEAMMTGAYFGKTTIHIGSELENQSYDSWRIWADQTFTEQEQRWTGGLVASEKPEEGIADSTDIETENATDVLSTPTAIS